ncbi:hypothetical protein [Phytoactinopolyspora limicola]|uniref:hypothetical protein n=1 Tax=Phytoactinopolyspora limicola TaxID=2715536 RepID=UPI00140AD793|nr:hypothetical protein [Phytoactinopolyspora limicola]
MHEVAQVVVRTMDIIPAGVVDAASVAQTVLLAAAMFGVGSLVRVNRLIRGGGPGLVVGLLSTLLISLVSVAGLSLL